MDEKLRRLKKNICKELGEYAERGVTAGNINAIYQMAVAAEKIMKMEVLEMELDEGYSEDGGMWRAEGGYSGRRGGGRGGGNSRDGSYERGGGSYGDSYGEEGSYARGGGNRGRSRGYSRDDGKHHMIEKMEDMMEEAKNPEEREELKKCIERLRDM